MSLPKRFALQRCKLQNMIAFMPDDELYSAVAKITNAVKKNYGRLVRRAF